MKSFKQFIIETSTTPEQTDLIPVKVSGKVQFKTDSGEWQDVKDYIPAGAETRTGLKSTLTLNPGSENEVTQKSGIVQKVPSSQEDAEEFSKDVSIKHGKTDFKVDKVGLSNDFKVVNPSTVLSVRG